MSLSQTVAEAQIHLAQLMKQYPDAGVVMGLVSLAPRDHEPVVHRVELFGAHFSSGHWVALADASMAWAMQKLSAEADPPRDLIAKLDAARTALGFAPGWQAS